MKLHKGYLYLFLAASSWGAMAILVKYLAQELSPLWQVLLRILVATSLSYIYLRIRRKKVTLTSNKRWPLMIFMGSVAYASNIIAYTYAFNYTKVANVLFILSIYPVISAYLASVFLKEKIAVNHIVALIILAVGVIFIFNPQDITKYFFGNMLSLYVGASFSCYVVISRYLSNNGESPETITFLSMIVGTVTTLIAALLFDTMLTSISYKMILGVILFGFLHFSAHILANLGFKTVKASTGTMILMLEGIIGSTLAYFFFGEIPSALFTIGAFLVLSAIYISTHNSN